MGIKRILTIAMLTATLPASAATVLDNAPAKKQSAQPNQPKANADPALAEYLQWHRESGFAIYASPLELIAPDPAPESCAKTSTPAAVN